MAKFSIETTIKLNNGVLMPIFGLGMYHAEPGDQLVEAVAYALKNGYPMIDTAKRYKNEADAGKGIKLSGLPREKVFVTTKLFTTQDGRQGAIDAIEDSLKIMGLDYIDQYLVHAPQGGKVLECYDVLLEYQKKGKIKSVGVSNFNVRHLEAMKNSGRPLPKVNQIEYHPWCRQEAIVEWCQRNGVLVVGYAPLTRTHRLQDPIVKEMASKYGKTCAQILIRYSLQKGFVTIPKSSNPGRIVENSNVFDFELSDEDMKRFDELNVDEENDGRVCWNPTKNDLDEFGPLV